MAQIPLSRKLENPIFSPSGSLVKIKAVYLIMPQEKCKQSADFKQKLNKARKPTELSNSEGLPDFGYIV